jgi:phage terminase large subunit-like protein
MATKTPVKPTRTRADRNIAWIQKFCHVPEGSLVGQPVILREWQRKELRRIYDNPAGTRRAIITFGRKNGKTALASFLLLLHLCGEEARDNSQLFSTAQSRDQAALIFNLAAKIIRLSPRLAPFITIRDARKELVCPGKGTLYRALSAEATTAFGLSPVFIVHDELGQVRGPRSTLYEALETATGAQDNPLSLVISTQAPTDSDLLSVLIDDGLAGYDPRVVVSMYTCPLGEDPFSERAVKLANPAFGDFQNAVEVMAMAEDARRMTSREAEFRNLVLNQRVEASSPFVAKAVWDRCGHPPEPLDGVPVYGGLDLSAVNDLTALVLVGRVDGVWQVHPTFWLPVFDRYDVQKLGFDRWGFKFLRPWLLRAGFSEQELTERFAEFGQGFASISPALRDLEAEILNERLAHGGHPVLAMCAGNAVVKSDPAGNRKLVKSSEAGRIDGMVALTMAMGVAPLDETEEVDVLAMVG